MRSSTASTDDQMPRYGIFFHFQAFSNFLAKKANFEGDNTVESVQYYNLWWKCLKSGQDEGSDSF